MKKIILILSLGLLPIFIYAIPNASITSVKFDKLQVIGGANSVTATIIIKNTGNSIGTFYITASARDLNNTWYDFAPTRISKTIGAGKTGTVKVTWSPGENVPIGICYFYMKVFKASTGSDFYTDYEKSAAFSIIAGTLSAKIISVKFDKLKVIRGLNSITATITIKNTGNIAGTFYITASARDLNNTWYDFSPTRISKTLNAGTSGSVQVSWSPRANVQTGNCYFYMKVFKASSGIDFYSDYEKSAAFSILTNPNPFPLTDGILIYHNYSNYEAWDAKLFMYDFSNNTKTELGASWNIDHEMNAHLSPDGSKLVFMGDNAGLPRDWDIYIWDFGSANPPTNLTNSNNLRDEDPKFSPDGNSIIFKQNGDLKVMNLSGSIINQLTSDGNTIEESMPYYTTNGQKVVYAKGAGANSDIYIINSDGSNNTSLYSLASVSEYYPIMRNNSSFFYTRWLSSSSHNDQIYLGDFVGNAASLSINDLTSNNSDAYPVGTDYLFFSSTRAGSAGYDLYLGQISTGKIWSLNGFNINSPYEDLGSCFLAHGAFKFAANTNPSNDLTENNAESNVYGMTADKAALTDNLDIIVFPNPTSGSVTIKGKNIELISIFNMYGQMIKQIDDNTPETIINLKNEASGVYFIKINTNNKIITRKIILD